MDKHPHADLIKAWADGAKIQFKDSFGVWWDIKNPNWDITIEYRIKPEVNEPWKPDIDEQFYEIQLDYDGSVSIQECSINGTPEDVLSINSVNKTCFPHNPEGKKQAREVAKRVDAALKGTTDVSANVGSNVGSPELDGKPLSDGMSREEADSAIRSAIGLNALVDRNTSLERENGSLKEELKTLQIRCENLHKAKEKLITSHAAIDGVTLTDGEIALIKALRAVKISDIYPHDAVIVYKEGDGELITDSYLVAFSIAITEGGLSALSESLRTTSTALEQIQAEQEGKQ